LVISQLITSHKIYIFTVVALEHIPTEIVNTIELIIAKAYSGSSSWAFLINYFTALWQVTPRPVSMNASPAPSSHLLNSNTAAYGHSTTAHYIALPLRCMA